MPTPGSAELYVLLLRGINVGGKNRLPMKDLVALATELGGREVRSYIQSGNLVYRATPALASRLPDLLRRQLAERFGLTVPLVERRGDELVAVAGTNPFLDGGADPDHLHVAFLAATPAAAQAAALDPKRSPGDRFLLRGRDLYLHCPQGLARTKLTNDYLDAKLATVSTVRNWRTVLALRSMVLGET